ncbi:MAG: YndJ family protein [Halobacteria archaeon]|nr:YndJ family protein [Halobacteria archaeon]
MIDTDISSPSFALLSAALGSLVWLVAVITRALVTVETLLALAILVFVPVALHLVATPLRSGGHPAWYRLAVFAQFPAGILAVVSIAISQGSTAGLLALPWMFVTVCIAFFGLIRLLPRGSRPTEETYIDVGLVYVPVGGAGLLLNRLGIAPFDFPDVIILLTGVHFHYAAFLLPVFVGLAGRMLANEKAKSTYSRLLPAFAITPVFIATGLTFSPVVEVIAVSVFVVVVIALSVIALFKVVPRLERLPALFVGLSFVSLVPAMVLAFAYGYSEFTGDFALSIPTMVTTHGVFNALGFALFGTVGWLLVNTSSHDTEDKT